MELKNTDLKYFSHQAEHLTSLYKQVFITVTTRGCDKINDWGKKTKRYLLLHQIVNSLGQELCLPICLYRASAVEPQS